MQSWEVDVGWVGDLAGHMVGHMVGHLVGDLAGHLVGHLVGHLKPKAETHSLRKLSVWPEARGELGKIFNTEKTLKSAQFFFCNQRLEEIS